MKVLVAIAMTGLTALGGCSTMGPPYIQGETGCDEIVDARDRLDCLERADQTEREWREKKRREAEDRKQDAKS